MRTSSYAGNLMIGTIIRLHATYTIVVLAKSAYADNPCIRDRFLRPALGRTAAVPLGLAAICGSTEAITYPYRVQVVQTCNA